MDKFYKFTLIGHVFPLILTNYPFWLGATRSMVFDQSIFSQGSNEKNGGRLHLFLFAVRWSLILRCTTTGRVGPRFRFIYE